MEYRLTFDLHTHTVFSHGTGTIADNAARAAQLGLTQLGIADHGPGHRFYGLKMSRIPEMRERIEEARAAHPGTEILLSVEANILNRSGTLDVTREEQKLFDYIIAGYHFGAYGEEPLSNVAMQMNGWWWSLTHLSSKKRLVFNTDMVVRSLYENEIRILTHPGCKAPFDLDEISKACEDRGVWMEINNKHDGLTVEGIRIAQKYDVRFVFSSDAHAPERVGSFEKALARAQQAGLDLSRVVNLTEVQS